MADLRIVDAPEIPTEDITGQEKLPTGGNGNYSISLDSLADYTKTKKDLADNTSVDTKVNGVRQELEAHIEDLLNPHQVTKGQIGLGNVDNTADADKPVSNSTQSAIISAVAPKADKTYVDNQLTLKANKADVDSSLLTKTDKTYVDGQLAHKSDKTYVESALLNKSDKTYVDGQLNLKSDKTYVDNQLEVKSDKTYTDNQLTLKADKTYVDSQDSSLQSQINQKATAEYLDNALTEQTNTVNTALSNLSTAANKFYPTLSAANTDIANIAVNQPVTVGEVANGGLWYKATSGATSLTKSAHDPLTQANNRMDANPLFKPVWLSSGQDVHSLNDGIYRFTTTVGATLLNLPSDMGMYKSGTIEVRRDPDGTKDRGIAKMSLTLYYDANEVKVWEKTGNGGSTGFAWLSWQKQVSRYEYNLHKASVDEAIATMKTSKAEINLFPNYALTSESSSTYQATLADESGYPTLTLNTGGVTLVAYDMNVVSNIVDVGKTISFSAEGYCSATGFNGGDLSIQALNSSGAVIQASTSSYITTANTWQKILNTLTIPAGTVKIRLRLINRNGTGNTVCKFRNATLMSDYVLIKYFNPAQQSGSLGDNIFFVAKTGNDSNKGTANAPFLTIQKAVSSLPVNGGIVDISGGVYRETVTSSSKGNVWIRSKRNERAMIFGSNQLVVTKTSGYTQVYQAPLAAKPVGMGGGRGKPVIFEFGTPSKPILDSDRHHLHRSRTHRLPYTEMFEAATKAELDTTEGRGKWFWESGVIYFAATDGGDATLKQYEARMRPTLIQTDGVLHLTRVDTFFSATEGGLFSGILVDREDCRTFGNYFNGWSDNCNITKSLYDEACGNGNDGMNGTVTIYNIPDVNTRLTAHYVEPHVHDNGDDGLSYHYRSNVRIAGGYGEYNTKADFVHVTGATCICDGTESNGTMNGFYIAATATGDSERKASYFKCKNTKARNNAYSYRAADDAIMYCENTKAINPTGFGYYQTGTGAINAEDCKYTGDQSKMKSGTVNVTNHSALT